MFVVSCLLPICSKFYFLVMSPSHPLAQSESLTPILAEELQGHITIVVEDSARVLNQGGDGLAGCGHRLVVPGFRQALNCAEQGIGVYGA